MNVLALETAGRTMSVALSDGTRLWETWCDTGFRHAETLMPTVASLCRLAEQEMHALDLVACSAGPGSFTALRIGMATAKGIARGAGCALKAIPSLPLLAAGREHWPGLVVPVMDARKGRVYTAAFLSGERLRDDADVPLHEFLDSLPRDLPILATGPDAALAAGHDRVVLDPLHSSGRGSALIEQALRMLKEQGGDSPDRGPDYIRLSDAQETLIKQAGDSQ